MKNPMSKIFFSLKKVDSQDRTPQHTPLSEKSSPRSRMGGIKANGGIG